MPQKRPVIVRNTTPEDFAGIVEMCRSVYTSSHPWTIEQLTSHHTVFPEGQFVAVDPADGTLLGMAASLIILWDDYEAQGTWRGFTDHGMFTNHDPEYGHTLYGAEVMARPTEQGRGVGTALYKARRELAERLKLLRIRAGARLRGYGTYAGELTPVDYVLKVVRGELFDPTLSFQLRRGFHVIDVVSGYLRHDEESLGYAATIQWLNPAVAKPEDYGTANPAFAPYAPRPGT
ncbi:MAG: GNAT family N-acetyltransferase [Gemmatimonadota bacterium]|nr:GNAT family N-acetyltransferase [Gemmatimonadota bacterium]